MRAEKRARGTFKSDRVERSHNLHLLRIPALLLLLAVSIVRAQVDTIALPFNALTIDNGLSQGLVSSIVQDRFGFLWFATKDGLNRYDGYRFTTFRHDPQDSTSISGSTVKYLHLDRHKRLWVVTSEGVDLFDPATERFFHVPIQAPGGAWGELQHAETDGHGDLWATSNRNFVKVTFSGPVEEGKPFPAVALKWFQGALGFTVLSDNCLWGGITGHALRITPQHNGPDVVDTLPRIRVTEPRYDYTITRYVEDTVRKTIYGIGRGQICIVDPVTGHGRVIYTHARPYEAFENVPAVIDPTGQIWIPTNSGLYRFDPQQRRMTFIRPMDTDLNKPMADLGCCFMERSGTMWLGTWGYGAVHYDPRIQRFNRVEDQSIRALVPTNAGTMLVSRWGHAFGEYDPARRRYLREALSMYNLPGIARPALREDGSVMAIRDDQGALWFSLNTAELLKYEGKGRGSMVLIHPAMETDRPKERALFPLMMGTGHFLWCGGMQALWRCDVRTNALTPFQWPVQAVDDPYWFTAALHEGPDGIIWAGTMQGLLCLDPRTGTWRHFTHDPKDPRSLSSNIIFSICPDPDDPAGVLWIGTSAGGLNRFDTRTGTAQRFTTKDGLPNDVVYGVLADNSGRLWISTNKGLSRFDRHTHVFRNFTVADGLQSNEFNRYAYAKDATGQLWFGGVNGFNHFDPEQLGEDSSAAPIQITGIGLINQPVDFRAEGSPLHTPAYLAAGITIPMSTNMVTFEFATMEFSAPQEHRYRYMLEGFDRSWINSGTAHDAVYTNLDPGSYTFRVVGSNRDGVWDTQGTAFRLTVLPPWWRTWWAWMLYVALFAGGIFTYIRLRTAGLKRQRALLERTVAERTTELNRQKDEADAQRERAEHSERVKQQFLANMSHEIRTPMNAIVGMSASLLRNEHPPAQQPYLDAIASSSETLLGVVNEILDLSKIESGKLELEKVRMEPRAVLHSVVDVLHYRAEEKGLKIGADVATDVPAAVMGDPVRLNQVLMNLVGNAIKFTERGSVYVAVDVQEKLTDAVMLRFAVTDTGIGIAADRLAHVFEDFMQAESDHTRKYGGTGLGLAISKRLVDMQGGTIQVESEPGKGSTFTFALPYPSALPASDLASEGPLSMHQLPHDLRILLVEDNRLNVLVAREELKYAAPGCTIDVAANGQLALDMHTADRYDLILMDVQMPVMDGYAATRAIRAMGGPKAKVPIVAMTANVMHAEVQQCMDAGMDAFVPKPFKQEELVVAIAKALGVR